MTRHTARLPRADSPLPGQRERSNREVDDREERLARVADVLAGVDERIAAEDAAAAHPA